MVTEQVKKAVFKAFEKEFKETKVDVGTFEFRGQVVIDLDIVVKRGEDILYTPTADIPLIPVLAVVMQKLGLQTHRDAISKILVEAIDQVVNGDAEKVGDAIKVTEEELDRVKKAIQNKLPKVKRAAPTNVKGMVRVKDFIPFEETAQQKVIEVVKTTLAEMDSPKTQADLALLGNKILSEKL